MRAAAVATAASEPLIPAGVLSLRSLSDRNLLLAGPQPLPASAAPAYFASARGPVPADATLEFVPYLPFYDPDYVYGGGPSGYEACGRLVMHSGSAFPPVELSLTADGVVQWASPNGETGRSPYRFVCPEPAPGGLGLYLRWKAFPGKVLRLLNGSPILAAKESGAAFQASATFEVAAVPAFLGIRPPVFGIELLNLNTVLRQGEPYEFPVSVYAPPVDAIDRVELLVDGPAVAATATQWPFRPTWVPMVSGAHTVVLRVWNKQGAWADAPAARVTVVQPLVSGGPTFLSPAMGSTVDVGPVSVTVRVADPRGVAKYVELYDGARLLGKLCNELCAPFKQAEFTFPDLWMEAGNHALIARQIDALGQSLVSAPLLIEAVEPAGAPKIAFTAPLKGTVLPPAQDVDLRVEATGADRVMRVTFTEAQAWWDGSVRDTTVIGESLASPFTLRARFQTGQRTFYAYATDSKGRRSRSAPLSVTFAHTIAFTAPAVAILGTPVTLTANITGGALGTVYFYAGDKAVGIDKSAPPGQPYAVTWTPMETGRQSLFAKFSSSAGDTTSQIATVLVKGPANLAPTVSIKSPNSGSGMLAGTPIAVTAAPGDVDGYIRRVAFYDGEQLIGTATARPWTITWTGVAGEHVLTAQAFDNRGNRTTSAPVKLTLKTSNLAPTVALLAPASGSPLRSGLPVTLVSNPGDIDGYIRRVEFFDGPTLIGTATTKPWGVTWTPTAGSHTLTAKAVDNSDVSTTSKPVVVTAAP